MRLGSHGATEGEVPAVPHDKSHDQAGQGLDEMNGPFQAAGQVGEDDEGEKEDEGDDFVRPGCPETQAPLKAQEQPRKGKGHVEKYAETAKSGIKEAESLLRAGSPEPSSRALSLAG